VSPQSLLSRVVRALATAATATSILAATAHGQVIHGHVVDESGAPVAHAELTVLPSGQPVLADASGAFSLEPLSKGVHRVRVRRVGFEMMIARVRVPVPDSALVIVINHTALALDTVHTIGLEQRLPRMFDRLQQHLGAALYGPALDSTFVRGGSRDLEDMLTVDRHLAELIRRPHCDPAVAFVDGIRIPGNLQADLGQGGSGSKIGGVGIRARSNPAMDPIGPFPADIEMYISQKDIVAIEVFDSPDFVHEPFVESDKFTFIPAHCRPIILIWSKYFQQQPWSGH